jgi:phage/plasmid-like protein (TIGR03299 family)
VGTEPTNPNEDAVFLGWQETPEGRLFPLYTITQRGHPSFHSSVSDETLSTLHLRIPPTPSPYAEARDSAWHMPGIALKHLATAREAVTFAGLNYTVAKKPMDAIVKVRLKRHEWGLVRTDTGDVLGVVGESHELIQNRDAFTFFDTLVANRQATYEAAGKIGKGKLVWILASLPGYIRVRGKDLVKKYILLTNSHFGRSSVSAKLTPLRLVCNNTLTAANEGTSQFWIRHVRNAEDGIVQSRRLVLFADTIYKQLELIFNRMANRAITELELTDYVRTLVPDNERYEDMAGSREIRDGILALHESGQGSSLARGTVWGAYNSVTEYADHLMAGVAPSRHLESIWFGDGEQLKLKALLLAQRML